MSAVCASPAPGVERRLDAVRALQHALYRAAKADPGRRFHALYDKVHRRDVLQRGSTESSLHPGPTGPGGGNRTPPVKGVGEPCAGEPHARFDGRGLETERYGVTAPAPDPTNLQIRRYLTAPGVAVAGRQVLGSDSGGPPSPTCALHVGVRSRPMSGVVVMG